MLRLIVLVALASLCSAGNLDGKRGEMMKKYAHHKIMESCFGRDLIKKYYVSMMEASKKCGVMDPNEVQVILTLKKLLMRSELLPFKWVPILLTTSTTDLSLCCRVAVTGVRYKTPVNCSSTSRRR